MSEFWLKKKKIVHVFLDYCWSLVNCISVVCWSPILLQSNSFFSFLHSNSFKVVTCFFFSFFCYSLQCAKIMRNQGENATKDQTITQRETKEKMRQRLKQQQRETKEEMQRRLSQSGKSDGRQWDRSRLRLSGQNLSKLLVNYNFFGLSLANLLGQPISVHCEFWLN